MRRTLQLLLALTVALTMIAAAGVANAANRASSTVDITRATGDTEHVQVAGTVRSDRESCYKNRKVQVWHDVAPDGPSSNDFKIGTVRTEDNGRWEITTVALPDKVYAKVKKNRRCKGDVSSTEVVRFK